MAIEGTVLNYTGCIPNKILSSAWLRAETYSKVVFVFEFCHNLM